MLWCETSSVKHCRKDPTTASAMPGVISLSTWSKTGHRPVGSPSHAMFSVAHNGEKSLSRRNASMRSPLMVNSDVASKLPSRGRVHPAVRGN